MREVINVELLEKIALELSLIPEDPEVKPIGVGATRMINSTTAELTLSLHFVNDTAFLHSECTGNKILSSPENPHPRS